MPPPDIPPKLLDPPTLVPPPAFMAEVHELVMKVHDDEQVNWPDTLTFIMTL